MSRCPHDSFSSCSFLSVGQERSGGLMGGGIRWGPPRTPASWAPLLHSAAAVSQDYSAFWFHQMRQRHWMGTVWPWWADLRGISGLLWWIGKNSGRLSTHSCVFVCFIMLWPLACLWLWLQPWTTFPSHWPHSSGSSRTADSGNSELSGTAWKLSGKHDSPSSIVGEKWSDRHCIIWKCCLFSNGCNCLGFFKNTDSKGSS